MGQVTQITGGMHRTSVPLAAVSRPVSQAARLSQALSDGVIAVQLVFDVTGSTGGNHPAIDACERDAVATLRKEQALADRIQLCLTKMSGGVFTTGYAPLARFEPLAVAPYGFSPHGELLARVLKTDVEHEDACRRAGLRVAARLHLFQADGASTDDYKAALQAYRDYQTRENVHVFPVVFPPVALDFVKAVSVHHEPTDSSADAIRKLFENLLTLIRAVSTDVGALKRTRSLKTEDLPKATP